MSQNKEVFHRHRSILFAIVIVMVLAGIGLNTAYTTTTYAASNGLVPQPFLGWSSWSLTGDARLWLW